jgi:hypothetical protein
VEYRITTMELAMKPIPQSIPKRITARSSGGGYTAVANIRTAPCLLWRRND